MKSDRSYCLGGCHYSQTVNQNVLEKVNPKTEKFVKIIYKNVIFVVVINRNVNE